MSPTTRRSEIRLSRFGSAIGLIFERGGSVEILMTNSELSRLLDAWRTYERGRKSPDRKLIAALDVLCRKVYGRFKAAVITEVPIAQWKAKITPVLRAGSPRR